MNTPHANRAKALTFDELEAVSGRIDVTIGETQSVIRVTDAAANLTKEAISEIVYAVKYSLRHARG